MFVLTKEDSPVAPALPIRRETVQMKIDMAAANKHHLDWPVVIYNKTDLCEVWSNETGETRLLGIDSIHASGKIKVIQVISVRFPSGCRLLFGRVKDLVGNGAGPSFRLVGNPSARGSWLEVSYSEFGLSADEQIWGEIDWIKNNGENSAPGLPPIQIEFTAD